MDALQSNQDGQTNIIITINNLAESILTFIDKNNHFQLAMEASPQLTTLTLNSLTLLNP